MPLEGLHHVTAICADAPRNVDFYARVLGLRLVKKTVNFDAPDVYHLYYGDETGTPGSIMTFFEFPGARKGRAGAGMVYDIGWRVGSNESIAFWAERFAAEGVEHETDDDGGRWVQFADPEGLRHTFLAPDVPDEPLAASHPDVPDEHAVRGFQGVRAYVRDAHVGEPLLQALGMRETGPHSHTWVAAGQARRADLHLDPAPPEPGIEGAGTVHHIAWSLADDAELEDYRGRAAQAGARATPIIDRQYFHSVYFRTPYGVLFELASRDIGFGLDEPVATLGQALKLPPQHEHLRDRLERTLTPLPDPRAAA
jgi:glyoxalase family protein